MTKLPKRLIASEGQNVSLSCKASGVPLPNTTWFKGNKELSATEISSTYSTKTANINIQEIQYSDGVVYHCRAKNGAGEASCNTQIICAGKKWVNLFWVNFSDPGRNNPHCCSVILLLVNHPYSYFGLVLYWIALTYCSS